MANQSNSNVGFDSFLDIVANLVGVMIILVVVVGANAASKWQSTTEKPVSRAAEIEALKQQAEAATTAARKMLYDNEKLEQQIDREARMSRQLIKQRHAMLTKLQQLQSQRDQQMEALDAKAKIEFEKATEIDSLRRQLVSVQKETKALQVNQQQPRETIEHYPTPIAKTVFSDEVHFQLSAGRLAYVPMDELISKMKSEWKVKAEKLKSAPRTRETVGPINGFRLQYGLEAKNVREKTKHGIVSGREIKFDRFVLLPASDSLGELASEALKQGSNFNSRLSKFASGKTTVSVWVYPDSYKEFAEVKNYLREEGFQTASWPLDKDKLISGGPGGFHTSAQ